MYELIFIMVITSLSVGALTSSIVEIYFIYKIFKNEFGCFSIQSLLTGEWDNENLKTGKITHYVVRNEISRHLMIIFTALFAIANIIDWIMK